MFYFIHSTIIWYMTIPCSWWCNYGFNQLGQEISWLVIVEVGTMLLSQMSTFEFICFMLAVSMRNTGGGVGMEGTWLDSPTKGCACKLRCILSCRESPIRRLRWRGNCGSQSAACHTRRFNCRFWVRSSRVGLWDSVSSVYSMELLSREEQC